MRDEAVLEPCTTCNKADCGATVILSVMSSNGKQFNRTTDCLECNRPFSISIFKLEWMKVDKQELGRGFFIYASSA
jgi:hypothetical protein